MKLPISRSTRNFLIVSLVLAGLHIAASVGCSRLFQWADHLLYRSNIPYFLMDQRLHVVREFGMAGMTFLHLPAVLLTSLAGPFTPSMTIATPEGVWALFLLDGLIFGFGVATLVRWLKRPPKLFSRLALPHFGRQTVSLALVLAGLHFLATELVYFGSRWLATESNQITRPANVILEILHPWLWASLLRRYAPADPIVITIAIADALVWGVLVVWALTAIRRRLF